MQAFFCPLGKFEQLARASQKSLFASDLHDLRTSTAVSLHG
jgi:hypothetical protein